MAFYTRAEIARRLGKSNAWVTMYVKREELILGKRKNSAGFNKIDDTNRINKDFIDGWIEEKRVSEMGSNAHEAGVSSPKKRKTPVSRKSTVASKKPSTDFNDDEDDDEPSFGGVSKFDLQTKKLQADIDAKLSSIRLNDLKEKKLRGESIPTEMVLNVFTMLGHSIQNAYKNSGKALMIDIAHKTKMSAEDAAKYKGQFFDSINEAHKNAIADAKKQIQNIIKETAIVIANENDNEKN